MVKFSGLLVFVGYSCLRVLLLAFYSVGWNRSPNTRRVYYILLSRILLLALETLIIGFRHTWLNARISSSV